VVKTVSTGYLKGAFATIPDPTSIVEVLDNSYGFLSILSLVSSDSIMRIVQLVLQAATAFHK
jgi:hypothetical protein